MDHLTVTGAIARGPELRFTPSGKACLNLTVASTPRRKTDNGYEDDGPTLFVEATLWGPQAEALAEVYGSDLKGRATVVGQPRWHAYTAKDGTERGSVKIPFADAIAITPSSGAQRATQAPTNDPWATSQGGYTPGPATGEPPF